MMVSGRDDSGFLPSSLAAMVTFPQLKSVFQSRYCLFLLVLLFLGCMSSATDRLAQTPVTQVTNDASWRMEVFVSV